MNVSAHSDAAPHSPSRVKHPDALTGFSQWFADVIENYCQAKIDGRIEHPVDIATLVIPENDTLTSNEDAMATWLNLSLAEWFHKRASEVHTDASRTLEANLRASRAAGII